MKIACLGWGSLIWKSGALPVAGEWQTDGPSLPVEFCRVSDGGELATAICMNAPAVPVLWAWLEATTLSVACRALREREAIPEDRCDGIGSLLITGRDTGILTTWAGKVLKRSSGPGSRREARHRKAGFLPWTKPSLISTASAERPAAMRGTIFAACLPSLIRPTGAPLKRCLGGDTAARYQYSFQLWVKRTSAST